MGRAHDPVVVDADVDEQLVEFHVLLRVRVDKIVELQAGDGQHGLAVELCVVEAVEEMDAAGPGSGKADAEPAGPFGIGAGHEGGRLLVADLHEPDLVLLRPECLHDAVDTVSGHSEDGIDAPINQRIHENVRRGRSH